MPPSDEGGAPKGRRERKIVSPPVRNQRFLPAPSSEGAYMFRIKTYTFSCYIAVWEAF